jgi:hypothetical protein
VNRSVTSLVAAQSGNFAHAVEGAPVAPAPFPNHTIVWNAIGRDAAKEQVGRNRAHRFFAVRYEPKGRRKRAE